MLLFQTLSHNNSLPNLFLTISLEGHAISSAELSLGLAPTRSEVPSQDIAQQDLETIGFVL